MNVNLNFQVKAAAATAAATTSQELFQSSKSPDPSRPGTKYPVQESLTSTKIMDDALRLLLGQRNLARNKPSSNAETV